MSVTTECPSCGEFDAVEILPSSAGHLIKRRACACSTMTMVARPPHFPDPTADPIALLEAALAEKDEIIAAQYVEMTGWRTQLEAALERLKVLESKEPPK
jgi:hypothetical protein